MMARSFFGVLAAGVVLISAIAFAAPPITPTASGTGEGTGSGATAPAAATAPEPIATASTTTPDRKITFFWDGKPLTSMVLKHGVDARIDGKRVVVTAADGKTKSLRLSGGMSLRVLRDDKAVIQITADEALIEMINTEPAKP